MLRHRIAIRNLAFSCVLGIFISACSEQTAKPSAQRVNPVELAKQEKADIQALTDQELYLWCNMAFDGSREASDANYLYPGSGNLLRVGTRVRVIHAKGSKIGRAFIEIQPEGQDQTYDIAFKFGVKRMSGSEYFHGILRPTDPGQMIAAKSPEVAGAIRGGKLIPGLTKEEALLARGYPPFHRTAGIEADDWMYYNSREAIDMVHFVDGKITSIEPGQPH